MEKEMEKEKNIMMMVNQNYAYSGYQFGFEEDETENDVEVYDIYAYSISGDDYMDIILKKLDDSWYGTKIGNLIDGVNKLDEFDSSLCKKDPETQKCKVTFTLAYAERDIVEPETDIVEPEDTMPYQSQPNSNIKAETTTEEIGNTNKETGTSTKEKENTNEQTGKASEIAGSTKDGESNKIEETGGSSEEESNTSNEEGTTNNEAGRFGSSCFYEKFIPKLH